MNIQNLIALQKFDEEHGQGTTIDAYVLRDQIGVRDMLAISGGRMSIFQSSVMLPVRAGYWVVITLTPADEYKVQGIFIRAGKITVKSTFEGIYAENVGFVAYQASCFENAA